MFCTKCATSLPAGTRFCTSCGAATGATSPAAQSTGDGPVPPDLHWAAVLGLTIVTCGLFWLFWNYKVARFVKKIDPASNAVKQALAIVGVVVIQVAYWVLTMILALVANPDLADGLGGLNKVFESVIGLIGIFMLIGMRKSLLRHYNSVEAIGLKLNELMTLVFGIVYFQYHLSNIAAWKKSQPRTVYVPAAAPLTPTS